jgi:site-specific DNA-methyltransferase (adenine-specific)
VKPYYEDSKVTIYCGDALDILPQLDPVDLVLTDPPYSSGGAFRADRSQPTNKKYQISGEGVQCFREYATFSGDNRDQRSFEKWCAMWMRQCLALVNDGAAIGCFIDWRNLACVIDSVQVAGWVYRGCVPWHKGFDQRPRKGWFRANVEFIVWGSAGVMLTGHKAEGECADGVIYHRVNGIKKEHQTQKPVEVMADLMRVRPEWGTVLDPFCGSGTTLVAAKQGGKRAVGIDCAEHNCETAARRCAAEFDFTANSPIYVNDTKGGEK